MIVILKGKRIKLIFSCILLVAIIGVSLVYVNTKKNEDKISAEQNIAAEVEPKKVIEKSPDIKNNYVSQNDYSKSPNGDVSAEVVRENGSLFDSILIKNKDNGEGLIALDNISYTNIERTDWLDNTRYVVCGHVNPSLEVYIVIDTQKRQIIGKYYGIGFTWNKDKDKLYYIETSPHFSEPGPDKIIDDESNIYFETQKGEFILDTLAISDDEQTFAFYIDNSESESRKLIVAKMNKNRKLQKQTTIDAQFGDIDFTNNKSIQITASDGTVYYYDI
ncbi:MAG TPA: hypothetical protein VN426_18310 [Syntrophomonadaceae bacterium]|nr:hypothetical protein [Syntrophomonadaceae bacterium]